MATVLTAIAPVLYSAAQEVSAEPFGIVDSIFSDFDNKGVAVGDSVKVPIVPVQAGENFTASNVLPAGAGGGTAEAISVTIDKSRKVSHVLTGEQMRSLENGGNYQEWMRQWAAQAMRVLRNEAEIDAATAIKIGASRAFGVAGTTPFATSLAELTGVRKILRDNGAPMADLQLVTNTDAELNLLNLGIVQQAFAAGSDEERRQGRIMRQFGFQIQASAGIATHTKGTATGFDVANNPGPYAIGSKAIITDGSDAGTMLPGDIVTWAGDTNKYVVNSAVGSGAAVTLINFNRPGIRQTLADTVEGTIGATYTPSFAFERSAIVGVMRPPLIPANPTIRTMPISDDKGMSYLFVEIMQYGQISWEIHLAWGFKVVQSEHVALILG